MLKNKKWAFQTQYTSYMQQLNVFLIREYLLYYDNGSHLGHHLALLSLHMYNVGVKI